MPRPPRNHIPGAIYHVISRGNRKAEIFFDKNDYLEFLDLLSKVKRQIEFQLYAYCLMPNHLLLGVLNVPLSRVMQRILSRYAQYLNRRVGSLGHVFQGRFKAQACQENEYFMRLIQYIHANPVRAGLVDEADAWSWSSHAVKEGKSDSRVEVGDRQGMKLDSVDAEKQIDSLRTVS